MEYNRSRGKSHGHSILPDLVRRGGDDRGRNGEHGCRGTTRCCACGRGTYAACTRPTAPDIGHDTNADAGPERRTVRAAAPATRRGTARDSRAQPKSVKAGLFPAGQIDPQLSFSC